MGTPQRYQNLVAKLAQTNYFVESHYSSNRLRQPAIRATTRMAIDQIERITQLQPAKHLQAL
jgi:hypothetical protein